MHATELCLPVKSEGTEPTESMCHLLI